MSIEDVRAGRVWWREAVALVTELLRDPSSHLCASVSKWDWPMSREAFLLADIHDRYTAVNFKKPKPYPRPMKSDEKKAGQGSQKPSVSQSVIRAALAERGHSLN